MNNHKKLIQSEKFMEQKFICKYQNHIVKFQLMYTER
jgi:hypothetical protein